MRPFTASKKRALEIISELAAKQLSLPSQVVFEAGSPAKEHYRRYKIKTVKGIDDFASMQEVMRRRYVE